MIKWRIVRHFISCATNQENGIYEDHKHMSREPPFMKLFRSVPREKFILKLKNFEAF